MKQPAAGSTVEVALITLHEMEIGVRTLSSYLKARGISTAIGFFDGWHEHDAQGLAAIVQWVTAVDPCVVGISSVEFSRAKALRLIAALQGLGRTVVAGGVDVTLNPHAYFPHTRILIRGEGEQALAECVQAVRTGADIRPIMNLWTVDGQGQEFRNDIRPPIANLDDIPHEDLLDLAHHVEYRDGRIRNRPGFILELNYQKFKGRGLFLSTTRGCLFSCSFCSNHRMYPAPACVRRRSVGSILERVAQLKSVDPSLGVLYFFDDDFFVRSEREIEQFSQGWKARIGLPFYVYASPVTLTEGKLAPLVDAGLMVVNMGIQTGSERVNATLYNRPMENRHTVAAARLLHAYTGRGAFPMMPPIYDLIINNPYEHADDILSTVRLLHALPRPFFTFMHSLALFQGTALHETALRDGMISGQDESTKHHFHDTLKYFRRMIRRGGQYYLNSLLYWMSGWHTRARSGLVPVCMVHALTAPRWVALCERHPRFLTALNAVLPTNKRVYNLRLKLERFRLRALRGWFREPGAAAVPGARA